MHTLSVEVTDDEYRQLVALHRVDVEQAQHTVERYLGRVLHIGSISRGMAIHLQGGMGFGSLVLEDSGNLSASTKVPHRGRDRAGWRNGAA